MKMLACLALSLIMIAAAPAERTIVNDPAALTRLRRNSGITLQWISFDTPARGHVAVTREGGLYRLQGAQAARGGPGLLTVNGVVLSIDRNAVYLPRRGSSSPAPPIRTVAACATAPTSFVSPAAAATGACSRWSSATG